MHIALWIVQALLALAFFAAGAMKLATPVEELGAQMAWIQSVPSWLPKFIGLAEVAGALGLILPAALRIKPRLTPLAAASLAVVMVLAIITHVVTNDIAGGVPSLVLLALAAFVAYGRTKLAPITPR